jgi:monoamine oxidase
VSAQALDTLIIGAGAAGLAAARTLHDAGQQILILEARDRIGGRAFTDAQFADFPVELGAEFIHGESAITHDLVRQAGLHTIPVVRMDNLWWGQKAQPACPLAHLPQPTQEVIHRLISDYQAAGKQDGWPFHPDQSLAAYFQSRGYDLDALAIADVLFAQTCCAELHALSLNDLIREAYADHAGKDEFRIAEGYTALFDWYSRGLPIRLNTPVTKIQWDADCVAVIAQSDIFHARRCILTIPVSVLKAEDISFEPPLPTEKVLAIRAFDTQPATKLIYHFRQPLWDESLTYMAHTGLVARWWTPGYGREGAAVICAYITAGRAFGIDQMTEDTALKAGLNELARLLGLKVDELRANLLTGRRVSWAHDPYARGGYAHIPPGAYAARPALAKPEANVLFFAGEATAYDTNPQTVHGAIESGIRAAHEVLG